MPALSTKGGASLFSILMTKWGSKELGTVRINKDPMTIMRTKSEETDWADGESWPNSKLWHGQDNCEECLDLQLNLLIDYREPRSGGNSRQI